MTGDEQKAKILQMDKMNQADRPGGEELQHLKRVSRVKHVILENYLPPWAKILGSRNSQLAYVDCFAGPGQYEMDGKPVKGSPVIAVEAAIKLVRSRHVESLLLHLVDNEPRQVERLETHLKDLQPYPPNLTVTVTCADSRSFVPKLLQDLHPQVPAFFFIDPYGHPLPLPVINRILRRERTEALINLMWFRINMDLSNPAMQSHLDELFGDDDWHNQPFMQMHRDKRERAFLAYFISRLGAAHALQFRIRHDAEDIQGGHRTKYYLLHLSNHVRAALLMKDIMWHLGDEKGTFDYSGKFQGVLISETLTEQELRDILLRKFKGKEVSFDELREQTWELPSIPKDYRAVLRPMEGKEITILRITSKKTGIGGADRIRFK
ncbi:MAG: three-Cys-motif partner protein TcmP [Acidobacteria bacterium]|nr:three-Cys-motif partner protein TcmP [Acidobacteriota bacterium]